MGFRLDLAGIPPGETVSCALMPTVSIPGELATLDDAGCCEHSPPRAPTVPITGHACLPVLVSRAPRRLHKVFGRLKQREGVKEHCLESFFHSKSSTDIGNGYKMLKGAEL